MVDKKESAKSHNKSEEIRKVARAMKEKGEKPRPVTIIAALKKQGVVVSSPQVSMVLNGMGFRPRRRRKGARLAVVGKTAGRVRKPGISVEDLVIAKKVIGQFGNAERALAAIHAVQQFEG
ncbi:MAG: hypothetical protein ACKOZU_05625 [Planctomycetaceae bacterium]